MVAYDGSLIFGTVVTLRDTSTPIRDLGPLFADDTTIGVMRHYNNRTPPSSLYDLKSQLTITVTIHGCRDYWPCRRVEF